MGSKKELTYILNLRYYTAILSIVPQLRYIATAKAIKAVGAKHSGGKSLSKTHKLSARMLRPYPKVMP
ncbi:MAG: hypothetical protein ACM65L_04480 [Microcoleus sp.]